MIKKTSCNRAAVTARKLVESFGETGKTDFPAFVEEQRERRRGVTKDGGLVAGGAHGIKGFLAASTVGALANSNFDKAVRILVATGNYQTKDVVNRHHTKLRLRPRTKDEHVLHFWKLQDSFYEFCVYKM